VHSLIFERILFKFARNILRLTISVKDYVLFISTHRAHACERTCARSSVIKHSLIYGPILFKFAVNILHIITSSKGTYVSCSRSARTRASALLRARAWLKHSLIFGRILFKLAGHILQTTTSYMGYNNILIMFTHRGHARELACAKPRD
jgi:hypothetical protein